MFEPLLKHNRDEFERLKRSHIQVVVAGLILAFVLGGSLMLFVYSAPWIKWVAILYLVAFGGVIGVLEIKKALVFLRDVGERERGGSRDER